jgi:beta-lactamase class A
MPVQPPRNWTKTHSWTAAGIALAVSLGAFAVAGMAFSASKVPPQVAVARLQPPHLLQRIAHLNTTPPPAELQQTLADLVTSYGEPVGVAVADVDQGWIASVDGDQLFPQQSVSKLWVAITALDAVDRGEMSLDHGVMLWQEDRSVFFQPIASKISNTGYATTISDIFQRALIESDNAANDKLLGEVGGVPAVTAMLKAKKLDGIRLGADERHLQSRTSGLDWTPALGAEGAFKTARARLPDAVRDAAMQDYLNNPPDGASPVAVVRALAAVKRGEVLSKASTDILLDTMAQARTGPRRLRGGLPQGWAIAHKTGTGQDWRGASIGINDVGLLTAPDGHTYAVAVMMRRTAHPVPGRLAFMQQVSRAVANAWAADGGQVQYAAATPSVAGGE